MRRTVIRRLTVLAIMVLAMLAFATPAAWADNLTVDTLNHRVSGFDVAPLVVVLHESLAPVHKEVVHSVA